MAFEQVSHRNMLFMLLWVSLCLFLALPSPANALFENKIESFSADQVEISSAGKVMNKTKIYVTPTAYRMDGMPGAGQQGMPKVNLTIIGFKKQNKQFMYNHDKKLFYETSMDEEAMLKELKAYENVDSEKVLGKEKVSGYPCVKKKVTTTNTIMGMKTTNTVIMWQSDKFEIPLRIQSENGQIIEYRNIDTGKPSGKLFQRPTGYKKANNMMAVMGIDFNAMAVRSASSKDKPRTAPQKNIQDTDIKEMMAGMRQAMGENADPEQMAQLQEMMSHAMAQAKQINEKEGAADGMWRIIPMRPGDKVGSEIKTPNFYNVVMGTNASLKAVCTYYENKLTAKGWRKGGMHIQNNQGFMSLMKGEQQLMVSSADNPGMEGTYKLFYTLQLSGPDI